jgi:ATP-dependent RNA helicase SUPV3L1/SUV3
VVEQIATHRFDPAPRLMWRNHRLEFGTVAALLRSLEAPPPHPDLARAREAEDVEALRALWADAEIAEMAKGGASVRLLWDVCQTPDFRKTSMQEHAALLGRIYRFLHGETGAIPSDWIEGQVRRLDRTDGDIDALSKRLAYVRTWTYVANRGRWVDDPAGWRERTRAVEDRLSDALHDRLTKRFVDRRTSVLMQRLKQKERLVAEVSDTGEVTVEGHAVGRIEGFRFRPDPAAGAEELKTLRAASLQALAAQFAHRADKFYNAPDTEIDVTEQGGLMWGADAVGRLEPGADILNPKVRAFVEDDVDPAVAERVARRLGHWIERKVKALFEPLTSLRDDPALAGLAKGVAFQLIEALGVIPRRQIAEDVKQLDQESRALLRKHGVRFGQHHVFMPALLKPAPTRFRILLWSLFSKFEEFPSPPPPGHVTIAALPGAPEGFYVRAGYRLCGTRALRIDMLERLADMLRAVDPRAGFEATPEMLSITGCTLDQFADLMAGLGYHGEKGERPKAQRPARGAAALAAAPVAAIEGEAAAMSAAAAEGAAEAGAAPGEAAGVDVGTETVAEGEAPGAAMADMTANGEATAETETGDAETPEQAAEGAPEAAAAGPVDVEAFYTFTLTPRRPARDRGPRRDGPPRQAGRGEGAAREGAGPGNGARGPSDRRREGGPPQRADGQRHDGPRREGPRQDGPRNDGPRPAGAAAAGSAPDRRRHDGARHDGQRPEAPADGARPPESRGPRPGQHAGGMQGGGAKPGQRPGGPKSQSGRPPRDEGPRVFSAGPGGERGTVDPDSPFAILKQLKDRM